jgi:hypothetical protein
MPGICATCIKLGSTKLSGTLSAIIRRAWAALTGGVIVYGAAIGIGSP